MTGLIDKLDALHSEFTSLTAWSPEAIALRCQFWSQCLVHWPPIARALREAWEASDYWHKEPKADSEAEMDVRMRKLRDALDALKEEASK